ncbi:hypothetical protein Dimus_007603 [Dionaea muscipula]
MEHKEHRSSPLLQCTGKTTGDIICCISGGLNHFFITKFIQEVVCYWRCSYFTVLYLKIALIRTDLAELAHNSLAALGFAHYRCLDHQLVQSSSQKILLSLFQRSLGTADYKLHMKLLRMFVILRLICLLFMD